MFLGIFIIGVYMSEIKQLKTPLTDDVLLSLNAGDEVLISGVIYTARDMAHKRLCIAIEKNQELPFKLTGAIVYFVGPTPPRPGAGALGAAGPTTSSRMDTFSPTLIAKGLKGMIGKGYRGENVRNALKSHTAVHFAAIGGAAALLSKHIVSSKVIAYDDLGTEAVRQLQVSQFPAIVAYDAFGNSVYPEVQQ